MTDDRFQEACGFYRSNGHDKAVGRYGELCSWQMSRVTKSWACFKSKSIPVEKIEIGAWDVSNFNNLSKMFQTAGPLYSNFGAWDVSRTTATEYMFERVKFFNSDLRGWDTSRLRKSRWMFSEAIGFNQDLSSWQMSSITIMQKMVGKCPEFNANLSEWDTSRVGRMSSLFYDDIKFNSNISGWDTSRVTKAQDMFKNAHSFDCSFTESWDISNIRNNKGPPLECEGSSSSSGRRAGDGPRHEGHAPRRA